MDSGGGHTISKLRIEGFKSIVSATLEPARLNVLIGANGSGKSNVLEAIGLLGCAVSGKVDEEAFAYRGLRPGRRGLMQTALKGHAGVTPRLAARVGDVDYEAALDTPNGEPSPRWHFRGESLTLNGSPVLTRTEQSAQLLGPAGPTPLRPDAKAGACPLVRSLLQDARLLGALDALESYAIYTPFTPMLRGLVQDPSKRLPIGLSGGRLGEAVRELGGTVDPLRLRRAVRELIDWVSDVGVERDLGNSANLRFQDRHIDPQRNWVAAADASEGALYVVFLLALLYHDDAPAMLAIDNVDAALNPRLARGLIRCTEEALDRDPDPGHRPQLFLTVHNPLALDALDLHDEDRTRLFVVDRALDGRTSVTRVVPGEALAKARATGRTLSMLWVEGALGGVPDL